MERRERDDCFSVSQGPGQPLVITLILRMPIQRQSMPNENSCPAEMGQVWQKQVRAPDQCVMKCDEVPGPGAHETCVALHIPMNRTDHAPGHVKAMHMHTGDGLHGRRAGRPTGGHMHFVAPARQTA